MKTFCDPPPDESVVTSCDLAAWDLTPADIAQHCPGATARVALDGSLCWLFEDLVSLTTPQRQEELP